MEPVEGPGEEADQKQGHEGQEDISDHIAVEEMAVVDPPDGFGAEGAGVKVKGYKQQAEYSY
jgi:hypothetical protein